MNLGKFQQIDLREYWGNEATDFTPWLAKEENIAILSETIGIDIEVEDTEVSIGSFKADILGTDSNNNKIIIENQLEKSNHDHLGKIITYASGVNASVIIWICSKITEEHSRAIDWLNEHTDENINFFAIEIELWKIDDSNPAPRFNIICRPNEWAKTTRVRAEPKVLSGTKSLYLEYWTYLFDYFNQRGTCFSLRKPAARTKDIYKINIITRGFSIVLFLKSPGIGCDLWIEGDNTKKAVFKLKEEKEIIDKEIGKELYWEEPEEKFSAITVSREGNGNIEDREQWEEITKWLKKYAELFYKTFSDRVKNLEL